jgi:hypothetical protein
MPRLFTRQENPTFCATAEVGFVVINELLRKGHKEKQNEDR